MQLKYRSTTPEDTLPILAMPRILPAFSAAIVIFYASPAHAMQPCHVPGGCIDRASASLAAPLDLYEQRCPEADPVRGEVYRAAVRNMMRGEDEHFLARLRASSVYADVRKEFSAQLDGMDKQTLIESCKKLLGQQ